jgi:DNA-binding NarL/FixJ family response regulator
VLESLTAGERGVADLVARGWTNAEVAATLNLRRKTVEWTVTNVYRKLELRARTELALRVASTQRPTKPGISPDDRYDASRR